MTDDLIRYSSRRGQKNAEWGTATPHPVYQSVYHQSVGLARPALIIIVSLMLYRLVL